MDKELDILSKLCEMENVEVDKSDVTFIPPPIWQISDDSVALLDADPYNNATAIFQGLKSGEVIVEIAGVCCKIKVN